MFLFKEFKAWLSGLKVALAEGRSLKCTSSLLTVSKVKTASV